MKEIIENFKREFGYEPTDSELVSLYQQGELRLTDAQEDALLKHFEDYLN